MPKRDLSPAAVAEILTSHYKVHGVLTSTTRVREVLATSTWARAQEWIDRAVTDGAVTVLHTHHRTRTVVAIERPRRADDPPVARDYWAAAGVFPRAGVHIVGWDAAFPGVAAPTVDVYGKVVDDFHNHLLASQYGGVYYCATDMVATLGSEVERRRAERDAEAQAKADAVTAAVGPALDVIRDAFTAADVAVDTPAFDARMIGDTPTLLLTIRGAAQIAALADALTTTGRPTA